jgi:hypothetical protein
LSDFNETSVFLTDFRKKKKKKEKKEAQISNVIKICPARRVVPWGRTDRLT